MKKTINPVIFLDEHYHIYGDVVLRSKDKVDSKPEIFSIGGFSVVDTSNREFMFDWEELRANANIDDENHLVIHAELNHFDREFFEGSNENVKYKDSEITTKFLTECKASEIFYECYENEIDDSLIPLEIVEFRLTHDDEGNEVSKEELLRYDKEDAVYL